MSSTDPDPGHRGRTSWRAWALGGSITLAGLLAIALLLFWVVRLLGAPEPPPSQEEIPLAQTEGVVRPANRPWRLPFFRLGAEEEEQAAVDAKNPYAKTKITGRVFDTLTGEGISKAAIRIRAPSGSPRLGASNGDGSAVFRSREDGRFSLLGIPPGSFELSVAASGYARRSSSFKKFSAVEDDDGFEIGLVRSTPLTGRVTDREGRPVVGASVSLGGMSSEIAEGLSPALTDDDGRFSVDGAPDLPLNLCVKHRDFRPSVALVPMGSDGQRNIDVVMERGSPVGGVVHDAAGPVAGARISLLELQVEGTWFNDRGGSPVAVSDAEGRFTLRSGPTMTGTLRVEASGYRTTYLPLGPSLDVLLERGARIAGRAVRSDGAAAVGAEVTIRSQTAPPESRTIGADGSFSFEGLAPAGWFVLHGVHPDFPSAMLTLERPSENVVLQFEASGRIQGMVVDAITQAPIQEYEAVALGPVTQPSAAVSISGALELDQLAPGRYNVRVRAPGHVIEEIPGVVVSPGAIAQIGVIKLRRTGGVSGRVIGGAGAHVVLWNEARREMAGVDEDGSFSLTDVEPGTYRIDAIGAGLTGHVEGVRVEYGTVTRDVQISLTERATEAPGE